MSSHSRALDKIYKRRDRYEIPDWQREEVWPTSKKQNLIDSILRGWKLPKFYFVKTRSSPEEFEVVDGQQRLDAIWSFQDGHLQLTTEQAARHGGATYEDLPDEVSDAFDDYEIEYDEINDATDEEVKLYFQRLQEGLPLNSSEKLNAVHSNLRDYCVAASQKPFFKESVTASSKRYGYFDIMAKVATIEIEGLDTGLRFDDVKTVFETNSKFSDTSAAAKRIEKALKLLHEIFPTKNKYLKNRTLIQSTVTTVCHLYSTGVASPDKKTLRSFFEWFFQQLRDQVELGQNATDHDFIAFQRTVNANVRSGARTRLNILLKKLFQQHPAFLHDLSKSPSLREGIKADCAELGKQVAQLITSCNERYSSKHGKDLFKATSKTTQGIVQLQQPITSFDQYKAFIDSLYFIFKEGVGDRLGPSPPESFVHVN